MTDDVDLDALTDPTMRAMVEVATLEFDGASLDGTAHAVVLGDLTVARVELGTRSIAPGIAGQRMTEAINLALESARTGARSAILNIPGLDPELRRVLEGDAEMPLDDVAAEVDPARLRRDFSGADGDVLVSVSGTTQLVAGIHLPDLDADTLDRVPTATNRAMAAAQLGEDGATPLNEQIDTVLEALDVKMSAIEGRLDGVDDILDSLSRDLGVQGP